MTVYVDIVLIENLFMDYIILFATGKINRCKISNFKLILSSLIGSGYAVLLFISNLEIYANIMIKILLSISMIYIAFTPKNLKTMIKQLLVFYLTSFAIGGCAFALLYFIKPQNIFMQNGFMIGYYPLKIVFLAAIVGFILITNSFKMIRTKISKKDMFCNIQIIYKKNVSCCKSIIDTGNMLKDPITKTDVIIVEKEFLKNILPYYLLNNIEEIMNGNLEKLCSIEELDEYRTKFRIVPFTSLGKENGMLLAFKPDKIIIDWEENKIENNKILIGIYEKNLTKSGIYNSLIGLDVLQERKEEYEHFRSIKV